MKLAENLRIIDGWSIQEDHFREEHLITNGSNFMTGNGYLGYRGTFAEWRAPQYTGCFVSDTYDKADDTWEELCNAPNGLYGAFSADGQPLAVLNGTAMGYHRSLWYRYGLQSRSITLRTPSKAHVTLTEERFASYASQHLLPARYRIESDRPAGVELTWGIDGEVWDLNGTHLGRHKARSEGENLISVTARTVTSKLTLAVASGLRVTSAETRAETARVGSRLRRSRAAVASADNKCIFGKLKFTVEPERPAVVEQYMAVYSSNDLHDPRAAAISAVSTAQEHGYDRLWREHRRVWDAVWQDCDIEIEGDLKAQALLRFNMYHNIIATPAHTDHLPLGARGLSCQAYQGAAFWDQEIYNLPMYLYTRPQIARNLLVYRHRTLDGAREKARKLGYEGAFYAWVSGRTGEEICPSYFFTDVLTGRRIRNHFNDWQIHISPDIAYTVRRYFEVTGDLEFMLDHGAEILLEVARFLLSRVCYKPRKDRYELIRLLGPDEYHENVDNNFFTALQTQFALQSAAWAVDLLAELAPERQRELTERLGFSTEDYKQCREVAAKLFLQPADSDTGLIEQFDGYFELEDTRPRVLKERLLDPGEYWGWPNGVAVETQVLKQADVLQSIVLHRRCFTGKQMRANYQYYEPRTQHGSSLSPSVHATVAAWIGRHEAAYDYFTRATSIDLLNINKAVSGGTFIGGIHTAACGAAWQIVVHGFLGMQFCDDVLEFCPRPPTWWKRIAFPLTVRGLRLQVRLELDELRRLTVRADPGGVGELTVRCGEQERTVRPGSTAELSARG